MSLRSEQDPIEARKICSTQYNTIYIYKAHLKTTSAVNNRKKILSRIDPCGTPQFRGTLEED